MTTNNTLIVPKADGSSLSFDLNPIIELEKRKKELSYVNKETAPELMYVFNEGFAEVSKMSIRVYQEYEKMYQKSRERRARVILDVAPEELKKRNLLSSRSPAGSEDLRDAVLDLDAEYNELLEKTSALKAAYQFLKIKAKSMEMAYQAIKKIIDPNATGGGYISDLSTTNHIDEEPGQIGAPRFTF